ncbi:hypothetical protein BDV30DRAFT_223557 [Aspergillus minisclerotigenes]|uniref:Uncharacterized protein n=1 Tax=Aspergillus minisclerotigenes TaxID=656917 RepID=A0A5N6JEV0_9EURO|nr:hypothetical protein BDV30DRAFT_223557 [Aspergillus minisclerotigenes]
MPTPSMPEEYAELMKHNGKEHYLYNPQRYSQLHPGSVGYFDKYGFWNKITDLSQPGYPDNVGFQSIGQVLAFAEATEDRWENTSSGLEAETSFGLKGGLSGLLAAAAPVEAEANASNKRGSSGTAALVTPEPVKCQRLEGGSSSLITKWVKKNGKLLMKSRYGDEIRDYGLWVIHTTWSTPECAIKMESAFHRNTSAGLDVGATDVGTIGGNGSSLKKLESKGWKSFQAKESDQGLVVAYGGARFRLHSIRPFWINPLKQTERVSDRPQERPVYNEKQEKIGTAACVLVYDKDGGSQWMPISTVEFVFDENRKQIGNVYWNRTSDEFGRPIGWAPYEKDEYTFDENGEKTGVDYFRPTRDSVGQQIEWEWYDKVGEAAEAKKKEIEMERQARREYEDEDEFDIECETVGMDEDEYDTETVERTETPPSLLSKCCVM